MDNQNQYMLRFKHNESDKRKFKHFAFNKKTPQIPYAEKQIFMNNAYLI